MYSTCESCLSTLSFALLAMAFQARHTDPGAAGAAGVCGCFGFFGFVIIALIVLNLALLVWVARDAKARGMDSAILWMILVMFTGVVGLVIYLFARPQGNTIACSHCGNKRLQVSAKCPHCGNA
jgi:uncharacterized membrane protein YhaH (DUF805 family)